MTSVNYDENSKYLDEDFTESSSLHTVSINSLRLTSDKVNKNIKLAKKHIHNQLNLSLQNYKNPVDIVNVGIGNSNFLEEENPEGINASNKTNIMISSAINEEMEDYTELLKCRLQERNLIYTLDEYLHALKVYATTVVPKARSHSFEVDVKVYFEIMGPMHDKTNFEALFCALQMEEISSRGQMSSLISYLVKRLEVRRTMKIALFLSQRIIQEMNKQLSDTNILLSIMQFLKDEYCYRGKQLDVDYCKKKKKRIKKFYNMAKKQSSKYSLKLTNDIEYLPIYL